MLRNIGYFALSSGIVSSGALGFFWFKSWSNRKAYLASLTDQEARDTTRPQYDYFGLNWGAKADMMIQDQINTGDILYYNLACEECLEFDCKIRLLSSYDQVLPQETLL